MKIESYSFLIINKIVNIRNYVQSVVSLSLAYYIIISDAKNYIFGPHLRFI